MSNRAGRDRISSKLVRDLVNLLEAHQFQTDPRHAFYALGMGDLAFQDRELVSVFGGTATFDALLIAHDATHGNEAVNLRVWNELLRKAGVGSQLVLPFTDSGKPQVLTTQHSTLGYAEDGVSSDDVILWSSTAGVSWGPASAGGAGPANYVFGDSYVILNCGGLYTGAYTGAPDNTPVFTSTDDLSTFFGTNVFFGNVFVMCYGHISDANTLNLASSIQAPWCAVIQKMTEDGDDVLNIANGRLRFDCGNSTDITSMWNTPNLSVSSCWLDDRNFLAFQQLGVTTTAVVTFDRCTGYLAISDVTLLPNGAEVLNLTKCDMVVDLFGINPSDGYRAMEISDSHVIAGPSTVSSYSSSGPMNPLLLSINDSRVAGRTRKVDDGGGNPWYSGSDPFEADFLWNSAGNPLEVTVTTSDVFAPNILLEKPQWPSSEAYQNQLTDPIYTLFASHLNMVSAEDPGDHAGGPNTYAPPLTVEQSIIFDVQLGARTELGIDLGLYNGNETLGFVIQQGELNDEYGFLGYTPFTSSDGQGYGSFVDVLNYGDIEIISVPSLFQDFQVASGGFGL